MSNVVIAGAGAFVGYMVGGPTGAQIGWAIGSAVAAGSQSAAQPSVADLRVQTAAYGTTIPYVFGKQRVAGNIIWADEKKTYTKTTGGKGGGGVKTTGYTINMMIGICAGPILGVSRVWANGDCLVDSRASSKKLIGNLYLGTMDQLPDPTYQAAKSSTTDAFVARNNVTYNLSFANITDVIVTVGTKTAVSGTDYTYNASNGTIKFLPGSTLVPTGTTGVLVTVQYAYTIGASNAPAYRGLAYMSLTNFDLGTSGVIPSFSFEVVRGVGL